MCSAVRPALSMVVCGSSGGGLRWGLRWSAVFRPTRLNANLRCRSETCCTRLAENTGRKNDAKNRHLGTIAQLCQAVSSQLRQISTIGKKNLLSSNIFSTCPHNMVNFSLPAAEIVSLVWCTPGNFNGFHILEALLHGTLVVDVSQTAALNRGRHLYSAGRPSRWALAHISSCF